MAEGIRLTHPTLRGVTIAVPHEGRRFTSPQSCSVCRSYHECKTYHLRLDGEGAVIVSQTVLERLRETGFVPIEMDVESPVASPPALVVAQVGVTQNGAVEFVRPEDLRR